MTYPINWDLDIFFKGGSHSAEFEEFVQETFDRTKELTIRAKQDHQSFEYVIELIRDIQPLMQRSRHASAFISCLSAADVHDKKARQWQGTILSLSTQISEAWTMIEEKLSFYTEDEWNTFIQHEKVKNISFKLEESREQIKEKLSLSEEKLAAKLAVDGYHAWGSYYNQLVGQLEFPFEEDGKITLLSAGQIQNRMDDVNREVRKQAFHVAEKVWSEKADLFATTINHLAGFRLNLYEARGWSDVLKEPLLINRMEKDTLTTMWSTIEENKDMLHKFMERKAHLLGIEKLAFYDVFAPLPNNSDSEITYEEACDLIIKHFQSFSPKLASFAEGALRDGWIEAENRAGKRPGGFCTNFPLQEQSRIFMTYDNSMSNVMTLAHELGHAYHSHCLKELEPFAQRYAMNVAETASTFAENIIADALVKEASNKDLKISLLENKISRSIAFFMNIHARFLFETRFYEARKTNTVSTEQLNDLMEEAQREAFGQALSDYSPTFWASKLHFHITGVPFYNFPYTFGYLFSLGIYKRAIVAGSDFEDHYINLLKDTARMTVEDLAKNHLQIDLTKPQFWQEALDVIKNDIEEFMELTKI
ncbi:M3 family oligoendopeptidase [Alkalihalobacillus trypoxylicola]|uniref:Oligoendopeptidase n=1 Tax=Alkalihalobacillus trypoxylicola TaxID=519424 RepID=A0A161QEM6_9BACI|nr:M3 family oligoendopeptidase [Alkalihalobacillus trypoxylicola]KYG27017.1 oligoendopeptidase [Alkalihalobacillus trypoxylicola]